MADLAVGPSEVLVPISLLQTTELCTSDKLVWVALELSEGVSEGAGLPQKELAASLGFCRQTIAKATRKLEALGWRAPRALRKPKVPRTLDAPWKQSAAGTVAAPGTAGVRSSADTPGRSASAHAAPGTSGAPSAPDTAPSAPSAATSPRAASPLPKLAGEAVLVAVRLLQAVSIPAAARLLHMQLQAAQVRTPELTMATRYAVLAESLQRGVKAVRRAVAHLVEAEWLSLNEEDRGVPVSLLLRNPVHEDFLDMLAGAESRIEAAAHTGQAIDAEIVTALVDCDEFIDDAAHGYLENRLTRQRLRYDRIYPKYGVAIEFNGPQHYHATERYDQAAVDRQRARDAIKQRLSAKRGIKLITFTAEDLSLATIREKLRGLLPLRNLVGGECLIRYLEKVSAAYRRAARRPFTSP